MPGLRAALLVVAIMSFAAGAAGAQQSEVAKQFVGAWRYIGTTVDGVNKPRGANPKGMIVYTAGGNMSVQIAPDVERTRAGKVMSPEEAKIAVTDYIAYFGSYTIDEKAGTVTHRRRSTLQPGDAAEVVRKYKFIGDRLILNPPNSTQEITWERIK